MHEFICEGEKYQLGGPKTDTVELPAFFKGLPGKVEVEGHPLFLKEEFHVTLVGTGKIIEKQNVQIPDFTDKIVNDFCEFVRENPVILLRYRNEFRFAAEEERRSVVVMCDVLNLDKFFESMNKKYGLAVECPPTHVTLYTLQPKGGIWLTTAADIKNLTKLIPNPTGGVYILSNSVSV